MFNNVKLNVIEYARRSILSKNKLFFFPGTHPINVDLGTPSHEYVLFKLISESFVNIRMRHFEKEFNISRVLKNKSSLRTKLSKLILFKNL